VISAVEQTPTYKRTREILESINSQATNIDEPDVDETLSDPRNAIQGTIVFS
jgi:cell division protein FtsZ